MSKNKKRFKNLMNRNDYWMAMAFMFASGSVANHPQACIIVGLDNDVLGIACNNPPKSIESSDHIIHAELNAIFNCNTPISGGVTYITHTPCYNCCLSLIAANVKTIVYFPTGDIDPKSLHAMQCAYGQIIKFNGNLNWIRDYVKFLNIIH